MVRRDDRLTGTFLVPLVWSGRSSVDHAPFSANGFRTLRRLELRLAMGRGVPALQLLSTKPIFRLRLRAFRAIPTPMSNGMPLASTYDVEADLRPVRIFRLNTRGRPQQPSVPITSAKSRTCFGEVDTAFVDHLTGIGTTILISGGVDAHVHRHHPLTFPQEDDRNAVSSTRDYVALQG